MRFSLPLDSARLEDLPARLSPFLASADRGYDTLLLTFTSDQRVSVTSSGNSIRITTVPMHAPVEPPPAIPKGDALTLDEEVQLNLSLALDGSAAPAMRRLQK
ncbi:MAG: hypothetical protein U1F87_08820 [Kiritimatiellia bacterium]